MKSVGSLIRAAARLPVISSVLAYPSIRRRIQTLPGFRRYFADGWSLLHPFDRLYRTDTSGAVASDLLPSSPHDFARKIGYAGVQPSIIRTALKALPSVEAFAFVDLGCGKGRALLVASEFPFRDIVGVELSPELLSGAQKNAAAFRRRFPSRIPVRLELADASTYQFPQGNLVVFLYNPFGEGAVKNVAAHLEAAVEAANCSLFVVYCNPVHGHCFDRSQTFGRFYAATLRYSKEEIGYGPDQTDSVVIWQAGNAAPPHVGAGARIMVTSPDLRAELSL